MSFIIRPTEFGHYQFSLAMEDGSILSSLQTFSNLKQCKEAIVLLKECLIDDSRICCTFSSIGGHYFYVCDEHRDPIAMSDIFSSKSSMKRCLVSVIKEGTTATIEDQMFQEFYIREPEKERHELVA